MELPADAPTTLLEKSLESGRIHSAYLLSGPGAAPREAAMRFARGLGCIAENTPRPCEDCIGCRRSGGAAGESDTPIEIDGTGKRGPFYRHIGDHPDLFWVEREPGGTRVRIGQVRAIQSALRLGANEGGWRVAVIADAEWLNQEAQNALLRVLEEPPDRTCIVLVVASASALLATIRSRCQRVPFRAPVGSRLRDAEESESWRLLVARFDGIAKQGLPALLDWAEEYRGNRAQAAENVEQLLEVGSEWLRERVREAASAGVRDLRAQLDAFKTLTECRRDLAQRNANPQMIAERGLFAVREATAR